MENKISAFQIILKDAAAGAELETRGYTQFPLLNAEQVMQLARFYENLEKEKPTHFYSTTHSTDYKVRNKASEFINGLIAPLLDKLMSCHVVLGGAFLVKPGDRKGTLQAHQDWNLVDETKARSYNLWVPLVDVDANNGAIHVLPGSHNKIRNFRGPGIENQFRQLENFCWKYLLPLNMKAGDALLYDHALLHASPPNQSRLPRIGLVLGILPEKIPMRLYAGQNNKISVCHCNTGFFLNHDHHQALEVLEVFESFESKQELFSEQRFEDVFIANKTHTSKSDKRGFISRFISKFTT